MKKECPCDYCSSNGESGCPRADAEKEVDKLYKQINDLEEELSQKENV